MIFFLTFFLTGKEIVVTNLDGNNSPRGPKFENNLLAGGIGSQLLSQSEPHNIFSYVAVG